MVNAHDVAAYIINEQHKADRTVDKLQLQKLLYLVLGAYYELWGESAFPNVFRGYANGPVVREVERTYHDASVGKNPIPHAIGRHPEDVSPELGETVALVLDQFGTWEGPNLEKITKRPGSPWCQARGDLLEGAHGSDPIEREWIVKWFREKDTLPAVNLTAKRRPSWDRLLEGDMQALTDLVQ